MPKNIFEFKAIWNLKNKVAKCLRSTDNSVIKLWARRKLLSLHYYLIIETTHEESNQI
jgi:hypothetical protein